MSEEKIIAEEDQQENNNQDIVLETNNSEDNQETADSEQDEAQPETEGGGCCYRVKVMHSNETHVCRSKECNLERNDKVIVESRYGKDIAKVLGVVKDTDSLSEDEITELIGKASEKDIDTYNENIDQEAEAMKACVKKVKQHNLDMKLVSAHYLDNNSKVLFFFTAEARVDFRALVKDLVTIFKMRIELRQIGVRDESRVLGGMAVCGRNYCCHGLTDRLRPVSIKMAKEQNLSLNSMKISGPCGRLLCCLSYEYDFYKEEKLKMPSEGSKISFKNALYRVSEVNILSKKIQVTGPDGRYVYLPFSKFIKNEQTGKWTMTDIEPEEN